MSQGGGEPVLIHDLLSLCLKDLERRLAGREVRMVRQIDRTCPEVYHDRAALKGIIETLLAEAAEATMEGGRIRVCLKHNRAAIMLSVKDTGKGLLNEERESILADPDRPPCPGAPLTLHACVGIAKGMGGSLFVNSIPGRGSTFYATFPPPPERRDL